jgi:PKD domain
MNLKNHLKPPVWAGLALLFVFAISRFPQPLVPETQRSRTSASTLPLQEKTISASRLEVFAQFSKWLESTPPISGRPPSTEVMTLARQRRAVMEELITSDPRQALDRAVSLDVWHSLPPELRAEVEEPFSALARYRVLPVCRNGSTDGENFPDAVRYTEIEGGPSLETHVFGSRLGITSKEKAPVQGIRLGNCAALREGAFHELTEREATVAKKIYQTASPDTDFTTGAALGENPVTALAGGKLFQFADRSGYETFASAVAALDEKPGPHGGSSLVFLPFPAEGGGFDLEGATAMNNQFASAWTETKKKVFMIRCDFSDKTDAAFPVVNAGTYGTLLNTTVSDNIENYSYGKTWIEATVSSTITRLPQTASYYTQLVSGSSRNAQLLTDAKAAYQAANPSFVTSNYDIIGVWFVSIGMSSGGLTYGGLAGGADIWIQGNSHPGLHVHEFGHNYGIGHSSFWKPSVGSTNPVDPAGTYEEYGDPFDVMGDGDVPEGVFHSQAKQRVNWLATGEWTDATSAGSGIYRLHRIDHPATAGVRGIRVNKSGGGYYWLSYRRLYENSWLKAGANLVWERTGEGRSWLVDTTPGSIPGTSDRTDGSIAIGRTYSDGNSHITPLARGGNANSEWLDIRVNTGPFAGNTAPTVTLGGPSAIAARQTCVFTAQGLDANGDALAYSWDFGQGFTFDNHPSAAYAWNSGGTYTVKVTVTDMKGLTAQATKTVTVTDPITTWFTRANSSIGDFHALAASPNKVIAVGEDYSRFKGPVATSTNGTTWTDTQLGQNQQAFAAIWDGNQFLLAGQDYTFDAPVGWLGCVFTSPTANANTWTRRIYSGSSLRGIAYGNNVHVAVGDNGTIRRSTDGGVNWSLVPSGTTRRLASVAFGGGKFVAVGHIYTAPDYSGDNIVLTSTDGQTWTNASTGAGVDSWQDFRKIAWTHDRFLASGWYSKIRHSTDLGATFSTSRTTTEEIASFAYGNGIWFATGIDKDNSDADVDLVSSDGSNWSNLTTPSLDTRNAAIFFNNTFITAGDNHSIRQSGSISQSANGYFTWRESNFPDHGPLTTPDGDLDADGMENLLEYSLGSSPAAASGTDGPSALPQAVVVSGEPLLSDRIALQIELPDPSAADLIHVVEAASSLDGIWSPLATKTGVGNWVWNAGGTSRIILGTPTSGRVVVKVGDSLPMAGNPLRFLRLRVSVNQ